MTDQVVKVIIDRSAGINLRLAPQGPPGPPGASENAPNYVEVSADYYPQFTDFFISVNCSDGPVNIFLPISVGSGLSSNLGCFFYISKSDSTDYPVIATTQEGQLIDAWSTTLEITSQNDVVGLISRGYGYKSFD